MRLSTLNRSHGWKQGNQILGSTWKAKIGTETFRYRQRKGVTYFFLCCLLKMRHKFRKWIRLNNSKRFYVNLKVHEIIPVRDPLKVTGYLFQSL